MISKNAIKTIALCVMAVFSSAVLYAQTTVSGTVTDGESPVVGASVLVRGTTLGTVTDIDGNFELSGVTEGNVIEISFIGFVTQTVRYTGQGTIRVVLEEDAELLEDVVVVGYGTQKKANMTGSVAQISSSQLENRPVQNVSLAIQGMAPGVTVTGAQGRPGNEGATIRIRGVGTMNTADPYILVDGVETSTLNSIDPNDIESISVLKDASSAAIYGSKASNGVILITTKRGESGAPRISYNVNVGFQNPTMLVDRLSSYDYARLLNQVMVDAGQEARFTDAELQKFKDGTDPNYPNTDWYDLAYKTGVQHTHNVSVSGGTDALKYMASVGYMHQTGILPNAKREQFNFRTNLDINVAKWMTLRVNMAYIHNDYSDPTSCYYGGSSDQIIRQLNLIAPWIVARYDDGTYGTISDGNPIAWLDLDQTVDNSVQNFSTTVAADFKLAKGLVATVSGSYVNNQNHYREFQKYIEYNATKTSDPNHLEEHFTNWHRDSFDALLNYDNRWGKHGFKVMAGYHAEQYKYSYSMTYREGFPTNDLTDMNAGDAATQKNGGYTRELNMISWFGRINYDFAEKYLFEANIRADASSRFAKGNRWGYFPSFSAAWRLTEESFMEGARHWLSNLKIRGSWGQLGNQDALSDYYPAVNTYEVSATYPLGGSLQTGYYQGSYKMEDISWEKSRTWGLGLDVSFFNKLSLSVDYYDRKTTDIIMEVPVPREFALNAYYDNVGSMQNRGTEVTVSYNDQWGNWTFGAMGNFSYNKNKILDLGEGVTSLTSGHSINKVGEAINSYYMYVADGFFESDAAAQAWMDKYSGADGYPFGSYQFRGGDLIYKDTNGDGKMTSDDRAVVGHPDPSWTFALTLSAGFKGFDLSATFQGTAGGSMYLTDEATGIFSGDATHPSTVWLDSWTETNKNATMPRLYYRSDSPSATATVNSSFWLQKTDYLRLKNLQFGYTFSNKSNWMQKAKISNLRIYYSAENLFTIHNMIVDTDPETSVERTSNYPLLRTHSFGINITF